MARLDMIRFILALAAKKGWNENHLDVKSVFLHGELKEVFVSVLTTRRIYQERLEQAVYTKRTHEGSLLVGIYVDDLIVTGNNIEKILQFKRQMEDKFEMNDLGLLFYYLGLELNQGKDGINVRKSIYAKKILQQAGMQECNPTKYPMERGLKLKKNDGSCCVDATRYRKTVGCLRDLVSCIFGWIHKHVYASSQNHPS
ncbi:hypothetical protein E3N88_12027 [Mikania micrantha]|uniref:Reverse transcriptase Ty1/copia-type domain-containing protein n=1 Tax=Mikania micrantha TaxID=192012 RepID=A0A5N6P5P5_9ASTR|nr:hypothetical protein E3N88_12027 [Mikania micrantha]